MTATGGLPVSKLLPTATSTGAAPTVTRPLRIALVNDYEVVVAGIASLLESYADRVEVVELDLNSEPTQPVDIAVYDTFAATATAADLRGLFATDRVTHLVAYSFIDDEQAVGDYIAAGADGYISKAVPTDRFVAALERIAAGERVVELAKAPAGEPLMPAWPGQEFGLTERESEILGFIAQGLSNDEIARTCYLSINTVKTYIRAAYRKAGVATRAQAVAWALRHGFRPERRTTR